MCFLIDIYKAFARQKLSLDCHEIPLKQFSVLNHPWPSLPVFNEQRYRDLVWPGLWPHNIGIRPSAGKQTF